MSDAPLVSIITPLYNSAHYMRETIDSVVSQTYMNWELILVDDCSQDNSVAIAKSYVDKRIKVLSLSSNSGAAVARNYAIESSRGTFICFLDSDDLWLPTKLEEQVSFMLKEKVSFSFMSYYKMNEEGVVQDLIKVPNTVNYSDLLKTCSIGCLTAMFNVAILGKQHMPLLRKRQDYGLWLKLIKLSGKAYGINMPLSCYRVHSESISSNKFNAAKYQWRIYREVEGLNILKTSYYFTTYMVYGILKTKVPRLYSLLIK